MVSLPVPEFGAGLIAAATCWRRSLAITSSPSRAASFACGRDPVDEK